MNPNPHTYHYTETAHGNALTVYLPGHSPVSINGDHPNFDAVLIGARSGIDPQALINLADLSAAVGARLRPLSERVDVANGRVYFDGREIDTSLSRHIVRVLDTGAEDWRPMVAFLEKLAQNPQEHSREQLFDWLRDRDFTIDGDGDLIAYKGVDTDENGQYVSRFAGPAIVDGEPIDGRVPNYIGAVVKLDRSKVAFNPDVGCSVGLHAGTYDYALHYSARGAMLKVKINPRDVVSVPTDCAAEKIRVCRYEVVDTIDAPISDPVVYDYDEDDSEVAAYIY